MRNSSSQRPWLIVLAFVLAVSVTGPAQTAPAPSSSSDPQELRDMHWAFVQRLREVLAPLNRSYIAALQKVETELAQAGDYERAIEAREERRRVAKALVDASIKQRPVDPVAPPVDPVPPATQKVTFAATSASPGGGATAAGGLATLAARDASLSWKLPSPMPGLFNVSIECASPGPATFWVRESFFRLRGAADTGDAMEVIELGALKITDEADIITLQALDIPAGGLRVKSLTFTSPQDE